jgi:hypothetical protein
MRPILALLAVVVLALVFPGWANAASITSLDDPMIFTEVKFSGLLPSGDTVSGFDLTYAGAAGPITNLMLLAGVTNTFSTNGINEVLATFNATSAGDFQWTFNTPFNFPINNLVFDFTGFSQAVTGGVVQLTVQPVVPEPASAALLATGLLVLVICRVCAGGARSACC